MYSLSSAGNIRTNDSSASILQMIHFHILFVAVIAVMLANWRTFKLSSIQVAYRSFWPYLCLLVGLLQRAFQLFAPLVTLGN